MSGLNFFKFLLAATAFFVASLLPCHGQGGSVVGGERIEQVVGDILPVWREETGVYVEVSGKYIATGDGSIVLRLADEKYPLTLAWNSAGNWQLLAPRTMQRDFSAQATPSGGHVAATWRLRIRGLQRPLQRAQLAVLNAGRWEVVHEKNMALPGLREWVEEGGILTVGIAGAVGAVVEMEDANVRVIRENTLFLVR